ncbi:MAG: DNA adenine methylase [Gammaproteobacteria bacterium]|nr:MAG: DNA adenine methylase [Gammaproteobacteria bacterium]
MKLPHPIQYQGSKRNLASTILKYFPSDVGKLIEPFAGTAAISVAAAYEGYTNAFIINELNKPLLELLKLIIEQPCEIANFYEKIWNAQHKDSIKHYYTIREEFNRTNDCRLFLYLLARCAKGAVRYNKDGCFNQSPDKRRKGTMPQTMKKNIYGVSSLLKGKAKLSAYDYRLFLKELSENDLVYMDPPYQGVCGNRDLRYYSGIHYQEFIEYLGELNDKNISYIISYDGKTGHKTYGKKLPNQLELKHLEIMVGRSTQATLLGKNEITYESLYLSPALQNRLNKNQRNNEAKQLNIFESNHA